MNETVIEESSAIPTLFLTDEQQTRTASFECKICEAPARYFYFGAVVCESCKMFFKRNGPGRQGLLKCHFHNECHININNRHACSSCRLKKCFAGGMRSEMIRSSYPKRNKKNQKKKSITDSTLSTSTALVRRHKKNQPEQIPAINLLRSDQSTLSIDQWNLLSNLVHCFDEYSGFSFVESFIQDQKKLPLKLRFKYLAVKDFFTSMMSKIQLVFEKNRDPLLLSSHDRTTLLRTTVQYTVSIGGMFVVRQHHLLDYPSFYNSAEMIFRPTATAFIRRVINQLDPDDTFIKIILAILSFSIINYTVYTGFDRINLTNVKAILPIQNMYTELAWRYVLYKYGHYQAVIRFSNLIRCLCYVNDAIVEAHESKQFTEIIDSVIEQTEQKLCL